MVFYNIHRFHNDKDYWGDPEVFRPERFLDNKHRDRFIPFGFGKRSCMGESLAKAELFMFIVMLLQRLRFEPPKEHPMPDPEADIAGVTRSPQPFHISIKAR